MEQNVITETEEREITVYDDGYLLDDFGPPDVGKPYLAVFDPNDQPHMIPLSPGKHKIKHKNGAITTDSINPSPTLWVTFDSTTKCTWVWIGTTKKCVPPWS